MTDWGTVVERHSPMVWKTAFRLLNNDTDASDCVQETFLAALEVVRKEPVRDWSRLLAHLCTCRALDQLRRRMRDTKRHDQSVDSSELASAEIGPEQKAEQNELSDRLRIAVTKLPDQQAEVFCLRYFNGMSYRQIAGEIGIQKSAVSVSLHRARIRLRELLQECVSDPEIEVLP